MDAKTVSLGLVADGVRGWIVSSSAQGASVAGSDNVAKPKEEKSKRDECMLFSKASDPASDCKSFVEQYKSCMAGFGFTV
ncbi:hypothetical protein E4U43_006647 [Claviceps pusilla]|uniref:Uncharacterized protein n=1 Tax=Claviceps pusilla TaxID=123648 RepID=A0A9P7N3L4_9HYPO|nr:hypothetical protein E4U43_006647 [Claviceps pusilla]